MGHYNYKTYSLRRKFFMWVIYENSTEYRENGMGHQTLLSRNKKVFSSFRRSVAEKMLIRLVDQNEALAKRNRK